MSSSPPEKRDLSCQGCPINCHKGQAGEKKNNLAAYAALWSIDPAWPGLANLVAEYHHFCDDFGLEAFETAQAMAWALKSKLITSTGPAGLAETMAEMRKGTELGLTLGGGRPAPSPPGDGPAKKSSGQSPEMTALLDSLGLCSFAAGEFAARPEVRSSLADMLSAKYGRKFTTEDLAALGQEVIDKENNFATPGLLTPKVMSQSA